MNREQKLNKREIKQAVKEILNEEKVTQDQLRLIIREELELQEKLREEKDNPSIIKVVDDFVKYRKWKAICWLVALWLVTPFAIGAYMMCLQTSTNIYSYFGSKEPIGTLIVLIGTFILIVIIGGLLIGLNVFLYERVNKYTKKYAKIATILILIYWVKNMVPGFENWLAYLL